MAVHKSKVWYFLLASVALVAGWFCYKALSHMHQYYSLQATAHPSTIHWSYREVSDEVYLPYADYTLQVGDQTVNGAGFLWGHRFRNPWAAEQGIAELSRNEQTIWYDPARPEKSSLQREFPLKESVSAALLIALFFYFLWLTRYVAEEAS